MLTVRLSSLNIPPEARVLDLGCGEGRHAISLHLLSPAAHVVAIDLNEADVKTAQNRLEEFSPIREAACSMLVGDGLKLPFEDGCFDLVICSEVLEHIPDYKAMLVEAHRVLVDGGQLAVSVPRAWPERICWALSAAYHQVEGGHVRIFKALDLQREIEQLAFNKQSKHWSHALHTPYWWLRCLCWNGGRENWLSYWYHKVLVWDLMQKPWLTQFLEKCLNPICGKSIVMYFKKE